MSSQSPDQIVIESVFKTYCDTEYPGEAVDDVFEKFAVTQVLKPKDLTAEELADGIVDGSRDGGLDSFFVFLNGTLLNPDDTVLKPEDSSIRHLGSHPDLEVFLIQSKNKEKWEETVWEHLLSSLQDLLNVYVEETDLDKHYRSAVVERTGILRRATKSLASKFPRVTFRLIYVTRAPEQNLTDTIRSRSDQVAQLVRSRLTSDAKVTVEHVGEKKLYALAGTEYSKPGTLKFRDLTREKDSFLGIVSISDYLSFIRDDAGSLREELFDSNVRDFEGDNEVNEAIKETLATNNAPEFWWLNNGITVLADKVDSPQNTLTISQPLVVNGLQTSHVLHRAEREGLLAEERRENGILVRVIESDDEETRDRIIAGTNRQTKVPGPALYATQPLQRDIERYLLAFDWYYERRKNRYKNLKKPAKRRITIGFLAQALLALKLGQPDFARARPGSILSKQSGYESLFDKSMDSGVYLAAIEIIKSVDDFLSLETSKEILDEKTNTRFYVAAGYLILKLKLRDTSIFHFEVNYRHLKQPLDQNLLVKALAILATSASTFQDSRPNTARDAIFKNSDFREQYFENLVQTLDEK